MLKMPANKKLRATITTKLRPVNTGFKIKTNETTAPNIPKTNIGIQFLLPYFLISIEKLIEDIDLNKSKNPTYNAKTLSESAGCISSEIPIIKVKMPKAKDHPQLSSRSRLAIEKIISERPPNKKESAKKMDSASNEVSGEVNTTILMTTNSNPTSKGMYQCLIEVFIDFKK